jgi:Sortilin, neurotensin receptor 3,
MGNVYISDFWGLYYSESIKNVLRGTEYVDFERVNSLDGVFLANRYLIAKNKKTGAYVK